MLRLFCLCLVSFAINAVYAEDSMEVMLAQIDANTYVSASNPKVAKYRKLLSHLPKKYIEDATRIGDMVAMTKKTLETQYGVSESCLRILQAMNSLFYYRDDRDKQEISKYLAMYLACRVDDMSHSDTILGIKQIVNALGLPGAKP